MLGRITLFLLLMISVINLSAQSTRVVKAINSTELSGKTLHIDLKDATPFIAYAFTWEGSGEELKIRFSSDGNTWEKWSPIHPDAHLNVGTDTTFSELQYTDKANLFFQIAMDGVATDYENLTGHFYAPGNTSSQNNQEPLLETRNDECDCALPSFQKRLDWCPAGNCDEHPNPSYTNVTHIIIHHSAGSNNAADWAAVVRSIWDFHVITRGWSDIGYNWLIDPNGVIYQGRGNDVTGAHFCGTNTATMGVCMMGTFTDTTPKEDATESLKSLLAWKSCAEGIDPLEVSRHSGSNLSLNTITGHRVGCSTSCPGDAFFPVLGEIRAEVVDILEGCQIITDTYDFLNDEQLSIYPNPMVDHFRLELDNEYRGQINVELYASNNQVVSQFNFQKNSDKLIEFVPTQNLSPGVYWMQIQTISESRALKIVKY